MAGSIHKSQFATSVKFEVDQASLASLKDALQDVSTAASKAKFQGELTQELNDAAKAAEHLSDILTQSWNTKLNQFDLTKLNNSIKESYGSVEALRLKLDAGGAVGANAFNKIGQAVLSTNIQLKQSNAWLDKMAITMSNTIRFGISSSIMNSFTGSIQKAYNYVQKLDKSLNDIRIVSDASAEDMERFAKYANKAAQSLGSSTLDYTQAALIYYQQGLVEDQVKERSDITVKMAHVTESTAQEVSDQLTAIWNNFYDGSQSLEYYADVLAKLGAETASSSEEISQGLEKFAAVSKTVGLSYEYAAAALTTVTATTRQSADVVGTAFKTLFARIQDLELGKTLDDGTTLGKYSEALQAVGVNIKDDFGQLKDMDNILDEMGSKWKTLSDDQKVALAQNVAGVRQYTQLMALMENWDFFKKNVDSARNATGALQKQQEIYLDSIAAHMEQLSAQAEKFYSSILNSKAIKTFTDLLTGALKTVNTYMTGLGGGFNSLFSLGGSAVALFSKQIGGMAAKRSINKEIAQQNAANVVAQQDWVGKTAGTEAESKATREGLELETEYYKKILEIRGQLNEEELVEANNNLKAIGELRERISFAENWKEIASNAAKENIENEEQLSNAIDKERSHRERLRKEIEEGKKQLENWKEYANEDPGGSHDSVDIWYDQKTAIKGLLDYRKELNNKLREGVDIEQKQIDEYYKEEEQIEVILRKINNREPLTKEEEVLVLKGYNQELEITKDKVYALEGSQRGLKESTDGTVVALKAEEEQRKNNIEQMRHEQELAKGYSDVTRTIGLLTSSVTAVVGAVKTWQDKDLDPWEKFKSIAAVIGTQGIQIARHWKEISNGFKFMTTTILPKLVVNLGLVESSEVAATMSAGTMWATLLLPVTAVVAALALVAGGIYLIYQESTKTEREIKSLGETIEQLEQKSEDTRNTISDLTSSFEELTSAENALSACITYSEEWNQKLINVNDTVDKILAKYPELLNIEGMVTRDPETGQLGLDENKFNKYVDQKQEELALNNRTSAFLKYQKSRKETELAYKKAQKEGLNWAFDANFTKEFIDEIRELVPNSKEYNDKVREAALKGWEQENAFVKAMYGFNFESYLTAVTESLEDNSSDMKTLNSTINNSNTLLKNVNKLLTPEPVAKEGKYATKLWNEKAGESRQNMYDKILEAEHAGVDKTNEQKDSDAITFMRNFVESQGWEWDDSKFTDVNWDDENREYVYDGKTYDATEMTAKIVDAMQNKGYEFQTYAGLAGDHNEKRWNDVRDTVNGSKVDEKEIINQSRELINKFMLAYGEGMTKELADKILSQDLDSLTTEDLENLNNLDPEKIKEAFAKVEIAANQEQIQELINGGKTKEEAEAEFKQAGYDKAEAYIKGFQSYDMSKAAENLENEIELIYKEGAAATEWTVAGLKDLANMLKKTEEGAKLTEKELAKYSVMFAKFRNNMQGLAKVVNNNEKALKDWAKANGDVKKTSTEAFKASQELHQQIKDTFGVDIDMETLRKNFKTIEKAIKGDTKALIEFQRLLAKNQLDDMELNWKSGITDDKKQELINEFNDTVDDIINQTKDLKIGAKFDGKDALKKINDFVEKSGMSQKQIQSYFDSIGYDAEVKMEPYKQTTKHKATIPIINKEITWKTESEVMIPRVKSLKKANDFRNYAPTKTKTGSGGGSSNQKAEKFTGDTDIYHEVNTQIAKIDNQIKKLQKDEERFLGGKLLNNYINQWKDLSKQIDNYTKKLKIAEKEQNDLRKKLEKKGAQFNEDGTIANYEEILDQKEAQIKKKIDKYNKERKKKSAKTNKARLEEIEKLKNEYQELVEDLNRADELASDFIPQIKEQIREALDNQIELNIKAFEIKIKYSADIKDLTTEVNDFVEKSINGLSEDNTYGNFKLNQKNMMASLTKDENGKLAGHLVDQAEQLVKMQAQYNKLREQGASIFGDQDAEGWDKHKEQLEAFIEEYSYYIDLQKQQLELVRAQREAIDELMNSQIENYTKIGNQLEHNKKLVQLIYGESAASQIKRISELQVENAETQLDKVHSMNLESQDYLQTQEQALINAKAQVEAFELAGDTESDLYKQAYNAMLEAEKNRDEAAQKQLERAEQEQEALDNYVDTINNDLVTAINAALEALNNGLTESGKGLAYAQQQWDLIDKEANIYLDTINSLQGQKDIESKYLESINKATNPNVQKKLKAAMDAELKALKDKDKLTQYDLDRAEKKYQITLAQIALEEAQQNKNKMRLRRDSQGNYRYQYVADEDAIQKAQEQLTSLYTDLYNFDKERFLSVNNDILSIEADVQNQIREIYSDTTKSKEEKEAQAALVIESYNNQILALQKERAEAEKNVNESAFDDLKILYGEDSEEYAKACLNKEKTMAELIPQLESEGNAIAANTNLVRDNEAAWTAADAAASIAIDKIKTKIEALNGPLDGLKEGVNSNIDAINKIIDDGTEKILQYRTELAEMNEILADNQNLIKQLNDEKNAVDLVTKSWQDLRDAKKEAVDELNAQEEENGGEPSTVTDYNAEDKALEDAIPEQEPEPIPEPEPIVTKPNITNSIPAKASLTKSQKKALQSFLKKMGYYNSSIDGDWGSKSKTALKKFQNLIGATADGSWGKKTWNAAKAAGYDTGGYTGAWGNGGRLAILHQKELVLNAQDTKNILDTVAIMRNLMASLNNNMLSRLAEVTAGGINGSGGSDLLEQNVHIEANFPNVTNSNEIEEAIKNLVNVASQRITK